MAQAAPPAQVVAMTLTLLALGAGIIEARQAASPRDNAPRRVCEKERG